MVVRWTKKKAVFTEDSYSYTGTKGTFSTSSCTVRLAEEGDTRLQGSDRQQRRDFGDHPDPATTIYLSFQLKVTESAALQNSKFMSPCTGYKSGNVWEQIEAFRNS